MARAPRPRTAGGADADEPQRTRGPSKSNRACRDPPRGSHPETTRSYADHHRPIRLRRSHAAAGGLQGNRESARADHPSSAVRVSDRDWWQHRGFHQGELRVAAYFSDHGSPDSAGTGAADTLAVSDDHGVLDCAAGPGWCGSDFAHSAPTIRLQCHSRTDWPVGYSDAQYLDPDRPDPHE